jgi:predicted TPR repeat methyltransferase
MQAYQRALKKAPAAPNVLYRVGLLHEAAGRKAEAVQAYKAALASARGFAERDDAAKHLAALGGAR